MRKLRVGIWIPSNYRPELGGAYSYLNNLINGLYLKEFVNSEIVFIAKQFPKDWKKQDKSYQIQTKEFQVPKKSKAIELWKKVLIKFNITPKTDSYYFEIKAIENKIVEELKKIIDVIYYPTPPAENIDFPFIATLWDIGHRSSFSFPELSRKGIFEGRNDYHETILQRALMIFTESETGKKNVVEFLRINEKRLKVVNLFPSELVEEECQVKRPNMISTNEEFIHYPAQFWSHKNHFNLIRAFEIVSKSYPNLKLILTGSDKGNKEYIIRIIDDFCLKDQITVLDFVTNEELKWIYKNSKGLVFPTLLGPTNMPLLEAQILNCPVACSNFEGHMEQLGEYAKYFDPTDPDSIAKSIMQMLTANPQNNSPLKYDIKNALTQIEEGFEQVRNIRFCWD
jgi:glycosyltransferase involved in cell wall biosynthesis